MFDVCVCSHIRDEHADNGERECNGEGCPCFMFELEDEDAT